MPKSTPPEVRKRISDLWAALNADPEMKELAFKMEELLYDDASFCPGFITPFIRSASWRWVRHPADFNVKIASTVTEHSLFWIDDALKKETLEAVKLVDGAAAGQPMANDFGLAWVHEDFLKATGNKEYVPFTITFDQSKVPSNVALYWRVVAKDTGASATLAVPSGKKDDKDKDKDKKPAARFAYEDINFIAPAGGHVSRAFNVAAGTYDVYLVMKEPTSTQKNAPPAKSAMIKQTVTVPDFWTPELATSSVIVASKPWPWKLPWNFRIRSSPFFDTSVTFCTSGCIWLEISATTLPPSSFSTRLCSKLPWGVSNAIVHDPMNAPASAGASWASALPANGRSSNANTRVRNMRVIVSFVLFANGDGSGSGC